MKVSVRTAIISVLVFLLTTVSACGELIPATRPADSGTPAPAETAQPTATPTVLTTPATPSTPVTVLSVPSFVDVVAKVRPAVVSIVTESVAQGFFLQPIPTQGAGSGIIFTPDGYVLTNNHVVDGATKITVTLPVSPKFPEGASFPGSIVGTDPLTDLAVIRVNANDLPTVPFGDSDKLQLGQWVVAIGNAEDLPGGPTVTQGIVSAIGRSITTGDGVTHNDLVQTDAAINPGNSGGPLVNLNGEVIGINSAILASAQNIGFAISSTTAVPVRDQLVRYGKVTWPWVGISGATLTGAIAAQRGLSATYGVFLNSIFQGSPADKAGLRPNDVIISFDGEKISTIEQLQKAIRKHHVGDQVQVIYMRGKNTVTVTIALGQMPAPQQ